MGSFLRGNAWECEESREQTIFNFRFTNSRDSSPDCDSLLRLCTPHDLVRCHHGITHIPWFESRNFVSRCVPQLVWVSVQQTFGGGRHGGRGSTDGPRHISLQNMLMFTVGRTELAVPSPKLRDARSYRLHNHSQILTPPPTGVQATEMCPMCTDSDDTACLLEASERVQDSWRGIGQQSRQK